MDNQLNCPDWLLRREEYAPIRDSHAFIDKSILVMLGVLSRMRREDRSDSGFLYRLDPCVQLLASVLLILLTALSRSLIFVLFSDALTLLLIGFLNRNDIKKILSILTVVVFFTGVLLIPAFLSGGHVSVLLILLKVFFSAAQINIFSHTSRWRQITRALKILFIPDVFILVLDITLKYIYLLGDFSLQIFYALKLRSVGRNEDKLLSLSGLLGNLFLKSKESAELLYAAMECRCFDGHYKAGFKINFSFREAVFFIVYLAAAGMFFVI